MPACVRVAAHVARARAGGYYHACAAPARCFGPFDANGGVKAKLIKLAKLAKPITPARLATRISR